jgi:hypothetical protein
MTFEIDEAKQAALELLGIPTEKYVKMVKVAEPKKRRHPKLPKDAVIHMGTDPWGNVYGENNLPGRPGAIMTSIFKQFSSGMTVSEALALGHNDSRVQKFAKEGWIWIAAADGSVLLQLIDETGSVVQEPEPEFAEESSLIDDPDQIDPEDATAEVSDDEDGEVAVATKTRRKR